ncbi:sulfite exporter TauE/SafE family protein [Aliiglaciecola sp. SL4]|uniref:sulfite exporter TauE/SafE family protein n=1 Tax=Aliiglaciecola sp. SL4 TaxID=3239806 RepID=UPI00355C9194
MSEIPTFFAVYLSLGAIVGLLAGLLGIGGGLIIVPVLMYIFERHLGLPLQHALPMAIATSLSTIILTGLSSTLSHIRLRHVNSKIVIWCALGIILGALVGPQIAVRIPVQSLKLIFAFMVLFIALQMIFLKPKSVKSCISKPMLMGIGCVTGIISAFMGIGGGAIMVPALVWFRVDIKQAIGCAAFCGMVIAIFGSFSFVLAGWNVQGLPTAAFGYIYLPAVLGIVMTSIFTAQFGAKISHRLHTQRLKQIFAAFLVVVSLQMFLG